MSIEIVTNEITSEIRLDWERPDAGEKSLRCVHFWSDGALTVEFTAEGWKQLLEELCKKGAKGYEAATPARSSA